VLASGIAILAAVALALQSPPLEEAKRLEQSGQVSEAIDVLEASRAAHQDDLDAGRYLAWLYGKAARPDAAIDEYRRLAARFPKEPDLHNSLGALLFRARQFDEAERELEAARELAPGVAMPHFNLGLLRFEKGEFAKAAASIERAIRIEPRRPTYHFMLARAYRAAYQFEKAVKAFEAGLALDPPPPMARVARLELALTLKHEGLLLESEKELNALLDANANDPEVLFQLGRLHVAMNRYPDAEKEFRRLVTVSPSNGPARFMLGLVSYRSDDPEGALASFQKLLELDPRHAEGNYYVGMILRKLGRDREAREAFENALRIDPNHVAANYNLALLLAKLGEHEASQKRLARFRELSESRERLEFLEERVRLNPVNARFYFDLGKEYAHQRRRREALQSFQRALELDPNLAAAEVAMTDLLSER